MTPKEIGREAGRIFQSELPHYLVVRSQQDQEDYGIDYEIEVMLPGDRASGVIFKIQEKGTTALKLNAARDTISFSEIETERMRYYLHDLRIPAALVVVDVTARAVYWVRLQGNTQVEEAYPTAALANQKTLTVHLPIRNKLPETLDEFLAEMARGQDSVMLRFLRENSGHQIINAANSIPDFEATLRTARMQADVLRLEHVERMRRNGDLSSAFAESRRIWESESETVEVRVAAGLNLIRFDGPMQPGNRSVEAGHQQLQRRLAISARMRSLTNSLAATHRVRLFGEFQDHVARMSSLTNQYLGLLSVPAVPPPTAAAALVHNMAKMATRQLVIEFLANFQEAHTRLTAIVSGGHAELIGMAWGMLAAEASIFIHLARDDGYQETADGMTAWFDESLPVAVQFAEGMEDWDSAALCALQQIGLAPCGNVPEIQRRAEIARTHIRRGPVAQQGRHLAVVDQQVAVMSTPPPVSSVEMEQEVLRLMALAIGGTVGDAQDPISLAMNIAIRDMNPDRVLRACRHLYVFQEGSSPLGQALGLPAAGMKWLFCTKHGYRLGSVSLDTAFEGFCFQHCDTCPDKAPHDAAWKWTPEWQAAQDQLHDTVARARPTMPIPPAVPSEPPK